MDATSLLKPNKENFLFTFDSSPVNITYDANTKAFVGLVSYSKTNPLGLSPPSFKYNNLFFFQPTNLIYTLIHFFFFPLAEIHTTTSTLNPTDFRIIHHDFPEHVLFFFKRHDTLEGYYSTICHALYLVFSKYPYALDLPWNCSNSGQECLLSQSSSTSSPSDSSLLSYSLSLCLSWISFISSAYLQKAPPNLLQALKGMVIEFL